MGRARFRSFVRSATKALYFALSIGVFGVAVVPAGGL
jgi:hypothetical protein